MRIIIIRHSQSRARTRRDLGTKPVVYIYIYWKNGGCVTYAKSVGVSEREIEIHTPHSRNCQETTGGIYRISMGMCVAYWENKKGRVGESYVSLVAGLVSSPRSS